MRWAWLAIAAAAVGYIAVLFGNQPALATLGLLVFQFGTALFGWWSWRQLPADVAGVKVDGQKYSLLLSENGGILDDLMLTRWAPEDGQGGIYMVVNGACKWDDIAHLREHLPDEIDINHMDEQALLALQGPKSVDALSRVVQGAIQGIMAGISFIGAGVILRDRESKTVEGLTTAATVWVTAALGIACGLGAWTIAGVALVLSLGLLLAVGWLERITPNTPTGGKRKRRRSE